MEPKVSIEIARFVNTFVGVAGRSWRLVSRAVSLGRTVRVARKRKYSWTISAIEVSGQAVRELESLYSRRANEERAITDSDAQGGRSPPGTSFRIAALPLILGRES
jgi:hypothetical protein